MGTQETMRLSVLFLLCCAPYLYVSAVPSVPRDSPGMTAANHTLSAGPTRCPTGDAFCEARVGEGSYCKYWQKDPKGRVCQGSTTPCQCSGCKGDAFCHAKVGPSSYCKYWQKGAGKVCQYSNVPCDCHHDTAPPALVTPLAVFALPSIKQTMDCTAACTPDQCATSTLDQCNPHSAPFVCTDGKAVGGCNKDASYWPTKPKDCNACCDTRQCKTTAVNHTVASGPSQCPKGD